MFTPADALRSLKNGGPADTGASPISGGGAVAEWLQEARPRRKPASSKASGQPRSDLGCVAFMDRSPPAKLGRTRMMKRKKTPRGPARPTADGDNIPH